MFAGGLGTRRIGITDIGSAWVAIAAIAPTTRDARTVTVANVAIFNIGAPFWGLVFGFALSWLLERKDFHAQGNAR